MHNYYAHQLNVGDLFTPYRDNNSLYRVTKITDTLQAVRYAHTDSRQFAWIVYKPEHQVSKTFDLHIHVTKYDVTKTRKHQLYTKDRESGKRVPSDCLEFLTLVESRSWHEFRYELRCEKLNKVLDGLSMYNVPIQLIDALVDVVSEDFDSAAYRHTTHKYRT